MNTIRLFPDKMKILSGSMLKLIAVLTMLIDHIAAYLIPQKWVLFSIFGNNVTLYRVMRNFGRWAFPIFAVLLIEGFIHTRSRMKYGISLAAFALISEIPWNLVHSGTLFFQGQNVFFTLLLGFLGLCVLEHWQNRLLQGGALIALAMLAVLLRCDHSVVGYAFIMLMYALRDNELVRPLTAFLYSNHWWVLSAFLPISMYNGKRGFVKGKVLKYAFYAFYPVHLIVIYFVQLAVHYRYP